MTAPSLKQELEAAGWRGSTDAVWERLRGFEGGVAFLAPPLDTIPSPFGNAIYSLVESLAAHLPCAPLVLARWPADGSPGRCEASDRILYDTRPMRPGRLEAMLPYRLKKGIWGTSAPHLMAYAQRAAGAARRIGIRTFVIEDIPIFTRVVRSGLSPGARLLLHQHVDAAKSVSTRRWRSLTRQLDGILFVADQTRRFTERLHGRLGVPSWVVYNGLDPAHFDPARWASQGATLRQTLAIAEHGTVMLFVGRVIPGKGVTEMAEAFNALSRPDIWLLIVGDLDRSLYVDPRYSRRLRQAAEQSNGRTILAGAVPQSDVPAWYAAADIVVVPSITSEGLPKTITEALAMGKPCATSDRGGARELIRDALNGWIIPDPVTPTSIRDTMVRASAEFRRLSPASSPVDISLQGMVYRFEQILAGERQEGACPSKS